MLEDVRISDSWLEVDGDKSCSYLILAKESIMKRFGAEVLLPPSILMWLYNPQRRGRL